MYFDERENNLNYNEELINSFTTNSITDNVKNYDNDFKLNIENFNINNFRQSNELYSEKEGLNKGNMFKNIYDPFKNYIYKVVVSGERDELLLKIQELAFKVIDLNLYLDVNPTDANIYNEYKNTIESLNKYKDLYEKNYGPLCMTDTLYYDSYMWTKNPWPWMSNGGAK